MEGIQGAGSRQLGEVLSTRTFPSLRNVSLCWSPNQTFGALCEGLSQGSVASPVLLNIALSQIWSYDIAWHARRADRAMVPFADAIRAGKLTGLQAVEFGSPMLLSSAQVGGEVFGGALTHADARLTSLEEVELSGSQKGLAEVFDSMSRGPGLLPALRKLHCCSRSPLGVNGTRYLSEIVSVGKVPSLKDLCLNVSGCGQEGMAAFAAALSSPRISALRQLDVTFGAASDGPAGSHALAAELGLFSQALGGGHLRRLEELQVHGLVAIEEVRALCVGLGGGSLTSLRLLDLCDIPLGSEGGRALSEVVIAEKLPELRILKLTSTSLTDEGLTALKEAWLTVSRLPSLLQRLRMNRNMLTSAVEDTLSALFASPRMTALYQVDLGGNDQIGNSSRSSLCDKFPDITYF
uniref:Uncharacterized protein n=1 Tax=Chromera velia CCMP2878 TaxID=1169474 RepID=A0A0G4HUH1_9ALVE|eukprot:Cvel_31840.t1-p1 / transcript=Cvel_31840.t1 / gene=Cvel_31840 / organism=Chromera_velia_CCMP2878 / gene_product=hypothetical protein / transcript_product=hypothetical protein / location=Cvel_scaffold4817:5506-6726(-) / protein_length=407 / sequence_SO=supercontig / SO=protein_coding / is_pseudo=false